MRGAWIEIARKPASDVTSEVSLPVRGAWIEIAHNKGLTRRCPSLPVRGAWIEISTSPGYKESASRRSPCGERGLKSRRWFHVPDIRGRSPCGERGLKWQALEIHPSLTMSLPVRGAWIEMTFGFVPFFQYEVAPRAGSVD